MFFRAGGGKAAAFGIVQQDNSPRLVKADTTYPIAGAKSSDNIVIPKNGASDWTYTGGTDRKEGYIRFETSGDEVRPINMAIKVWRRIS